MAGDFSKSLGTINVIFSADSTAFVAETEKYNAALTRQVELSHTAAKDIETSRVREIELAHSAGLAMNEEMDRRASLTGRIKDNAEAIRTVGMYATAAGGAIVGAVGLSVKAAIDWETAFTSVAKAADTSRTNLDNLSAGIKEMSTNVPISANELAQLSSVIMQFGVQGEENILKVTRVVADMGTATNLTAEQAAQDFVRFATITGMPIENVDRLGATIVALGNGMSGPFHASLATTEADINAMAMRLAGAGDAIGLTEPQIVGLAAALSGMGLEAEMGSSAFQKLMVDMASSVTNGGEQLIKFASVAGMSVDQFKQKFQTDAMGAIQAFLTGLGQMDEKGGSTLQTLEEMGFSEVRMTQALLRAANASGTVTDAVNVATDAWKSNTALTDEAERRYGTLQSQLTILWNEVKLLAVSLGESLVPAIKAVVDFAGPLLKWLADVAVAHPIVTTAVMGLAAAIGGLLLIIGPLLIALPGLVIAWTALGPAIMASTISLGPWGIAIAAAIIAIGALGYAIYAGIGAWKEWAEADRAVTEGIANNARLRQLILTEHGAAMETLQRTQAATTLDTAKKTGDAMTADAIARRSELLALQENANEKERISQELSDRQMLGNKATFWTFMTNLSWDSLNIIKGLWGKSAAELKAELEKNTADRKAIEEKYAADRAKIAEGAGAALLGVMRKSSTEQTAIAKGGAKERTDVVLETERQFGERYMSLLISRMAALSRYEKETVDLITTSEGEKRKELNKSLETVKGMTTQAQQNLIDVTHRYHLEDIKQEEQHEIAARAIATNSSAVNLDIVRNTATELRDIQAVERKNELGGTIESHGEISEEYQKWSAERLAAETLAMSNLMQILKKNRPLAEDEWRQLNLAWKNGITEINITTDTVLGATAKTVDEQFKAIIGAFDSGVDGALAALDRLKAALDAMETQSWLPDILASATRTADMGWGAIAEATGRNIDVALGHMDRFHEGMSLNARVNIDDVMDTMSRFRGGVSDLTMPPFVDPGITSPGARAPTPGGPMASPGASPGAGPTIGKQEVHVHGVDLLSFPGQTKAASVVIGKINRDMRMIG